MLLKGQLNICKDNDKDSALESVNLIHCEKFFQALMMDHFTKIVNS